MTKTDKKPPLVENRLSTSTAQKDHRNKEVAVSNQINGILKRI